MDAGEISWKMVAVAYKGGLMDFAKEATVWASEAARFAAQRTEPGDVVAAAALEASGAALKVARLVMEVATTEIDACLGAA